MPSLAGTNIPEGSSYVHLGRTVNTANDTRRSWAGGKERLGNFLEASKKGRRRGTSGFVPPVRRYCSSRANLRRRDWELQKLGEYAISVSQRGIKTTIHTSEEGPRSLELRLRSETLSRWTSRQKLGGPVSYCVSLTLTGRELRRYKYYSVTGRRNAMKANTVN